MHFIFVFLYNPFTVVTHLLSIERKNVAFEQPSLVPIQNLGANNKILNFVFVIRSQLFLYNFR